MTGLSIPDDFPLNELVAQELNQLAIGRHSLSLNFARDRVDIEAGFEFQTEGSQVIRAENSDLATPAASLFPLLGQCVTAVERLPNNRSGKRKCHFCDGKCVNPSFQSRES